MLRWIALSAVLCAMCVAVGLGKVMPLGGGIENFFLAMAALFGTVMVSSYDAYETQAVEGGD